MPEAADINRRILLKMVAGACCCPPALWGLARGVPVQMPLQRHDVSDAAEELRKTRWGGRPIGAPEPKNWFRYILYPDGTPYPDREIEPIRNFKFETK